MDGFFHWCAGVCVAGLLVVAAPNIAHQAMSDEGDGCSGAAPDCPSHYEAWDSLPPTCH